MAEVHSHHHNPHSAPIEHLNRAFVTGIILNLLFVIIEFIAGFSTDSLALLSDAGHNLSDVASLGLALLAFRVSKSKATEAFTYGYSKSTILVSLINAVILLITVGSIGLEAIQRFSHPQPAQGKIISIVAGIGIVINTASALLFFRNKEKDINIKGAFLHLIVDAVVSLAVVVAGVLIFYTGKTWIDPLISLVIMCVLLLSTWNLLKESLRLSLDAVPQYIKLDEIKSGVLKINGIKNIHHVHVWAMSTTKNAMTAHLILDKELTENQIAELKQTVKHELEHYNIHHATLETEFAFSKDEVAE